MKKVKEFFHYCSGASSKLLKNCPTDTSKYAGIGATIFFTGLFAALASGYAFYTVFDNALTASILGLVWGLMIFNLDRYIVSSMRKADNNWYEFRMAAPRILLAILISIVIAKPLELKIFEKEINGELALMAQEVYKEQEDLIKLKYTADEEALLNQIAQLKAEILTKTAERNELAAIAQQEADGTGGTRKRNAGPIYRIKKADADRVNSELEELKQVNGKLIAENYQKLSEMSTQSQNEIAALIKADIGGPAARLEALSRLTYESSAIWWANVFIILLFIVVEASPILVKLVSKKSAYDYVLETVEYKFETDFLKDKAFIHHEIKKKSEALSMKEKKFVDESLDMKLDQHSNHNFNAYIQK